MGRYFSHDTAKELGKYANRKILAIQGEYTRENGSTPQSRARLARLRRDLDGSAPSWMLIGDELFAGWPESVPLDDAHAEELNAVKTALELYAVHQQSRRDPAAQVYADKPWKRMTFGRACRHVDDGTGSNGVWRRLSAIETAPDFEGTVRGMRSLIMLMRKVGGRLIQLDYRTLTYDLYQLQFPERRSEVLQRWSRDYHSGIRGEDDKEDK